MSETTEKGRLLHGLKGAIDWINTPIDDDVRKDRRRRIANVIMSGVTTIECLRWEPCDR